MSGDVFVFHSSEADDPSLLEDGAGWYIGVAYDADVGAAIADGAIGPYPSEDEALKAMVAGAWLR